MSSWNATRVWCPQELPTEYSNYPVRPRLLSALPGKLRIFPHCPSPSRKTRSKGVEKSWMGLLMSAVFLISGTTYWEQIHPLQSFISILSKYKSTEQEATEIKEVRDGTWLKHNRHHLSLYFLEHSNSWIKCILIANQHWHAMFCCRVFWCSPWYTRPEMLWLALTSCTVPRRHCLCCSQCKGYVLEHKRVSPEGPGWSSP